MTKKIIFLAIVTIFIFSTIGIYAAETTSTPLNQPTSKAMEKTKDRMSRAINNIFYGPMEIPNNLDETKTKGTPMDRCTAKTRSGVERGIARVVTGIWQVATFWYSDPGCVTSSKVAGTTSGATTATKAGVGSAESIK